MSKCTIVEVVSVMMFFYDSLNNLNSTSEVSFVGMLYFNENTVLMKQYMDLESMRVQKVRFWIWSDLQTSSNVRDSISEFELERVIVLR